MKTCREQVSFAAIGMLAFCVASLSCGPPPAYGWEEKPLDTRTSTVHCLAFRYLADGKKSGSCRPIRVTVGGAPAGTVRVGFFESDVGASGSTWRSAGWAAATTAAQITEFDPHAVQVAFDVKGRLNGPSAGALMTIGIVAAVRGDKVRQDAAMTGTINPDGIVGPVGGITYKISGAAAAGKKLVVIPQGTQMEYDANTKEWIDLIAHGKRLGVTVKPALDIYTAYGYMTGKELSRPKLYGHPEASAESEDALKRRSSTWIKRYQHALKTYTALPEDARPDIANGWIKTSTKLLERAKKSFSEGETTAAYMDITHANCYAYMAQELGRNVFEYNRRGLAGAVKRLRNNSWLQDEMNDVTELVQDFEPQTLDQLAMYFTAMEGYFEAICCQKLAQITLASLPTDNEDAASEAALAAAVWQITAWLDLKLTANYLSLAQTYKGKPIPKDAPIAEMGDFYFRAYEANENVLETIVIEEAAKAGRISPRQIRYTLMKKDVSYAIMRVAHTHIAPKLKMYFPNAKNRDLPYLASSLYLHLHGSMLVSKYHSLGANLNKELEIVSLRHERTFNDWLEWSEDEARRNIGFLKARGLSTTTLSHIYEAAHASRTRKLDDRIRALTWFYNANVNAQVIRRLAGMSLTKKDQPAP